MSPWLQRGEEQGTRLDLMVIVNWDLFCQAQGKANRLYAAAKARYSANWRRTLDDCASANTWRRTLKGHVFGAESDVPPLCSPGCAVVSDPMGKAKLLSAWFDSKQSRDIVELPLTCHPRPAFCGIAFKAREVERYLLHLGPNGGVDPSSCFPMFLQKTASIIAPKLSRLFRRFLRSGEFPLEWRIADVTPIPKGSLSALLCKTGEMLIARSRTVEPLFHDLVIDGSVVEMVSELKILGVILDSKLAFIKSEP